MAEMYPNSADWGTLAGPYRRDHDFGLDEHDGQDHTEGLFVLSRAAHQP